MNTITRKGLLICATLLIAFAGAAGKDRTAGGVLKGVVLNSSGHPVASAGVFLQSADGTAPHAVRTDSEGRFRLSRLPTGLYEARAEASGMASDWKHNIDVAEGEEAEVTLKLIHKAPPRSARSVPSSGTKPK